MIPDRLRKARIDKNWSLKDLSSESNVAYEQISRYESGKSKPNRAVLLRLANALNVSTEYLEGTADIQYQDLIPGPSDERLNHLLDKIKGSSLTGREKRVIVEFLELVLTKKEMQQIVLK